MLHLTQSHVEPDHTVLIPCGSLRNARCLSSHVFILAASQAIVEATQNMSKYGADLGANIRSLPEKEPEVLKPMLEKLQEALYANAESLEQMPQVQPMIASVFEDQTF